MNAAQLLPLAVVALVFVVLAGGAAWWQQRRTIAHLGTLLDVNEQNRRALAEQLMALRQQVEADLAARAAVSARPLPAAPPAPQAARPAATPEAARSAPAGAGNAWAETMPVEP